MNPLKTGKKVWLTTRDYFFIVFGTMLYAFAFTGFVLPHKVVIGGVTGVGSLVFYATGVPVAITQYGINLVLLAFAWKIIGKTFVFRTIFGATCLSVFIGILQPVMQTYFPDGLVEGQPFMCILIAAFLMGSALGLVLIHNGSTGGTDIIAMIVAKKSTVSIGRTMLYCDLLIISSSYLLFGDLDVVVYGLVVLFLTSYVVDRVINSNRQSVQFFIISRHWVNIADAINMQANRGCTVLDGMGWYSKHNVKVLMVICRRLEAVTIFRIIKSVDPNAFISQGDVRGVYGNGFDEIKVSGGAEK